MTKQDTIKLLGVIQTAFPTFTVNQQTATVWHKYLEDLPINVVSMALDKYIMEAKTPFAPSISELRQQAVICTCPDQPDPQESYNVVVNAIQRYGSYHKQEALAILPEQIRRVVNQIGWERLCKAEEDALRKEFIFVMKADNERTAKQLQLPASMRQALAASSETPKALPPHTTQPKADFADRQFSSLLSRVNKQLKTVLPAKQIGKDSVSTMTDDEIRERKKLLAEQVQQLKTSRVG